MTSQEVLARFLRPNPLSILVVAIALLVPLAAGARNDRETVSPIHTLTHEEIERTGANSASDLLSSLPGCSVPAGGARIDDRLRGLGAGRTLVLVDGRRTTDASAGSVDLSTIPTSAIDRVEVMKDGGSAIYGSDACSGVVNLILKRDAPIVPVDAGASVLGDAFDALGPLRFGWDPDRICDFGAGAPTPFVFALPPTSLGAPKIDAGSWTWTPLPSGTASAAPDDAARGWPKTVSGGEPSAAGGTALPSWPKSFEGWSVPPWSLVQRTPECPDALKKVLEPLYGQRDQARADWVYFSDYARQPHRAPADQAADQTKADQARAAGDALNQQIRQQLAACAPGGKPTATKATTSVPPSGSVIDTLRISTGNGPNARFDIYPIDFGAKWALPGTGVSKDTVLGAGDGPLRGLVGGGRVAQFGFGDLGLTPFRIPSGLPKDGGGAASDWSIGSGLRIDWQQKVLDLSLDYAPREQRDIELIGKGSGTPTTTLDGFPRAVLDGIPKDLRPYVSQGYSIGNDLHLTFGWPESVKLDTRLFKKIPGYSSDEDDACGEEAQPAAAAASGGEGAWALERVGLGREVASAGGAPIIVGVIDTGLDWNHLDLEWSSLWRNDDDIPANGIDDDRNGYIDDVIGWDFVGGSNKPWDYDGHGTFVAGIIAASPEHGGATGVNPSAQIMVLKALNGFGHTRASYVAQAIVYGADNGAKILNLSVAGPGLPRTLQRAIRYAESKGVLVIVAAGNEGKEIADVAPAGLAGVMTVAATNENDARAPFSNHGEGISIAAPGTNLLSLRARRSDFQLGRLAGYRPGDAVVGTDRRYYRSSGTSFAAPIVAGVASLVWSKTPTLTAAEVRERLEQTARDVEVPGRDLYTGFGIVDARAALAGEAGASIVAEIDHADPVKDGGAVWIEVTGSAGADGFRRAWLELGEGESPSTWKRVGTELTSVVEKSALGRIPVSAFAGSKVWTVRLVVEREDGKTREVRYTLKLG